MNICTKKYQIVSMTKPLFKFKRFDKKKTSWAYIYEWVLSIGFIQIRKWNNKSKIKIR